MVGSRNWFEHDGIAFKLCMYSIQTMLHDKTVLTSRRNNGLYKMEGKGKSSI